MTRSLSAISSFRAIGLSLAVVAALAVMPAAAEILAPGSGSLRSISNGTAIPVGAVVVTPGPTDFAFGDDPLYGAARDEIRIGLQGHGMRVEETAPITLKLQIDIPNFDGHVVPDEPPNIKISSEGTAPYGPSRKPRVASHVELPFDQPEPNTQGGLAVALFLFDTRGTPLWSATIRISGATGEAEDNIRRMVRAAMATLGANSERSFELACGGEGANGLCLK